MSSRAGSVGAVVFATALGLLYLSSRIGAWREAHAADPSAAPERAFVPLGATRGGAGPSEPADAGAPFDEGVAEEPPRAEPALERVDEDEGEQADEEVGPAGARVDRLDASRPPTLSLLPGAGLAASGFAGGPFAPRAREYALRNRGRGTLAWRASVDAPWLDVAPAAGTLGPGGAVAVVLSVDQAAAAALAPGAHAAVARFEDLASGARVERAATLVVRLAPGLLAIEPPDGFHASGPAGGPFAPASASWQLTNAGGQPLTWSTSATAAWLAAPAPSGGVLAPGEGVTVQATHAAAAAALAPGAYAGRIDFVDATNGANARREATLDVAASPGVLAVEPAAPLVSGGPRGGPFAPTSHDLALRNVGGAALSWTAASDAPWLAPAASAGTLAPGAEVALRLDLVPAAAAALPDGRHAAVVTLTDASAGTAQALELELFAGVAIEDGRWLRVDGAPFLPIYVWQQPPVDAWIDVHRALGINTYMDHGYSPNADYDQELLDRLEARGMHAVLEWDPAVVGHPALLGWLLPDEPYHNGVSVAALQAEHDAIRAGDPYLPVVVNLSSSFYWDDQFGDPGLEGVYQQYTDVPEVVGFDMYPVTGWNQPTWVYMPGAMAAHVRDVYVDGAKPVWAIVEASDQRLSWTPPETTGPSPAQLRFEAWDAVVRGATAVGYFTIAFNPFEWSNLTPAVEAELTRTNGQLTALQHAILRPAADAGLAVTEESGRDVHATARAADGVLYVFATNADMGYGPARAHFAFDAPPSSVTVVDEGRTIAPSGAGFVDDFAPLEVHVYQVTF